MSWLKVTREIAIEAPIERVWEVATHPIYTNVRDPLFELIQEVGTPSGTGSSYTVRTLPSAGTTNVRLHGEVIAAEPPVHYRVMITTNDKSVQPQEGRLREQDGVTVLSWTVDADVPLFVKGKAKASFEAALDTWLASVRDVAESDLRLPND